MLASPSRPEPLSSALSLETIDMRLLEDFLSPLENPGGEAMLTMESDPMVGGGCAANLTRLENLQMQYEYSDLNYSAPAPPNSPTEPMEDVLFESFINVSTSSVPPEHYSSIIYEFPTTSNSYQHSNSSIHYNESSNNHAYVSSQQDYNNNNNSSNEEDIPIFFTEDEIYGASNHNHANVSSQQDYNINNNSNNEESIPIFLTEDEIRFLIRVMQN
jgi:hypothetical protein